MRKLQSKRAGLKISCGSFEKLQQELTGTSQICHDGTERYSSPIEANDALKNQPTIEQYDSQKVTYCTNCNWYVLVPV